MEHIKVGDAIIVHEEFETIVTKVCETKVYFLDSDGVEWYDEWPAVILKQGEGGK